jgi:hypothetical protein
MKVAVKGVLALQPEKGGASVGQFMLRRELIISMHVNSPSTSDQ